MRASSAALPLFLIIGGGLWLLKSLDWFPDTAMIVAFALVLTGFLTLFWDGINKQSVVTSPLLMYTGLAIYLRYAYFYATSPLIALGMMVAGILMLLSRSDWVPHKKQKQKTPPPSLR